jgi:hypothetical protein
VDSARKPVGLVSKTPYTILYLNGALLTANPDVYADPGSDPDKPTELLSALLVNDGSAGPFAAVPAGGDVPAGPVQVPASGGI